MNRKIGALIYMFLMTLFVYFIKRIGNINFGKDDGVVLIFICTTLISGLLFFTIEKSPYRYFLGIVIGISSYILIYSLYYVVFVVFFKKENGINIPVTVDMLLSHFCVYLFCLYRLKK